MYNCYNEALQYLISRYGGKQVKYNIARYGSPQSHKEKITLTYRTDRVDIMTPDDKQIHLLIGQYNLGIEPKRELYYKLLDLKIITEKDLVESN